MNNKRINLGILNDIVPIPKLISIALSSSKELLQLDIPIEKREEKGLQEILNNLFPVASNNENAKLEFLSYEVEKPTSKEVECIINGESYCFALFLNLRLQYKREQTDEEYQIIEEKVSLGEIPITTTKGTYIHNGIERCVINQLHRSPGIYFEDHGDSPSQLSSGNKKVCNSFIIIPERGTWTEFKLENSGIISITLDNNIKTKKVFVSTFLKASNYYLSYGLANKEKEREKLLLKKNNTKEIEKDLHKLLIRQLTKEVVKENDKLDDETKSFKIEEKVNKLINQKLLADVYSVKEDKIKDLLNSKIIIGKYFLDDIIVNGEVVVKFLEKVDTENLLQLKQKKIVNLKYVDIEELRDYFISDMRDNIDIKRNDALLKIYSVLRSEEVVNVKTTLNFFEKLYFDPDRFKVGVVGRYKINKKFKIKDNSDYIGLNLEDIILALQYLLNEGTVDNIDHLSNRRVKTAQELIFNQFYLGFFRLAKLITEKLNTFNFLERVPTIAKFVNVRVLQILIKDFFGRGQLSQFLDQTNPLAEMTAKRRLSALGPGGLNRNRAGFEVRDIHHSHYGRICPIETPEGANIGLILSLCIFAKINKYGFIETPYRKVINGKVTKEIEFLDSGAEEKYIIAQANAPLKSLNNSKDFEFVNDVALSRDKDESYDAEISSISYMDISPKQLLSVAASCIPFIEHDDANRALMGANMQRQAVPLLILDSPIVGTGMEEYVAKNSGEIIISEYDGLVVYIDGRNIEIKTSEENIVEYELYKYVKSNSNTCKNQKFIVKLGDKVKKGDIIADGYAIQQGELALGKNIFVAFMSWYGYNFEDALIISEKLVQEDVYTSIHILEASVTAKDTKLGPEEITRDIPGLTEYTLRNLDSEGVIRIGAVVKSKDILVGKITPKNQVELTPEEKLLETLFGVKASSVSNTSLYAPVGLEGIVIDLRIKRIIPPASANLSKIEKSKKIKNLQLDYKQEYKGFLDKVFEDLKPILLGKKFLFDIKSFDDNEKETIIVPSGRKITKTILKTIVKNHKSCYFESHILKPQVEEIFNKYNSMLIRIQERYNEKIESVETEESGEKGKISSIKIYVATKRKIQIGDKMAGRHGNKGIVSIITPKANLPFTKDGEIIDMILNPLGVPSRMNIGQIFETHLGWAAKKLNIKVASPVFDGVSVEKIKEMLKQANIDESGKITLYDGYTGLAFEQKVMVGIIYMLKLDHLVVNKIHARAVGPYSLVSQQPLGGKSQNGGQRFGEMEVWALEAYGAAHTLREMLTIKSDDLKGRDRIYENIIKGDCSLEAGIPESFNVSIKEMQSLCLDIQYK